MNTSPALTPDQVQRVVTDALAKLPLEEIQNRQDRLALLAGLDNDLVLSIPESLVPRTDLENMVRVTWAYRDAQGRSALVVVLDNAITRVQGSFMAPILSALRTQILNLQNDPGFLQSAATPAATEQYIAAACQLELPPLGPVAPGPEDRSYVTAVRGAYRIYRDPSRYIGPSLMPPADYMPGEVVYRRPSTRGGSTVQLWSLCKTNQELIDGRRLLVLGRPGIGKTSLIQYLAWQFANLDGLTLDDGSRPPEAAVLPLVISLAGWHDPPGQERPLVQYIKDFLTTPPRAYPLGKPLVAQLDAYLENLDQQRRLLFLLDDYNRLKQTDPAAYEQRWQEIATFADVYTDAAVVVVCRSLDYDGHLDACQPGFAVLEVSPWSKEQIAAYLRQQAPPLLRYLDDARLLDLAAIPQVLLHLVAVVQRKGADPERLLADPRLILRLFIDQLFLYSEQTGCGDPALRAPVQQLLAQVAHGLARDGKPGRYIDRATLTGYAGPDLLPQLDRLLEIAGDTTILDAVPGAQLFGFEAQLLENYFALQGAGGAAPALMSAAVTSGQAASVLQGVHMMIQTGATVGASAPVPTPAAPG